LKSARDRMDIIFAYQQLGSYRAAAEHCGTTHRTVKKVVDKFEADQAGVPPLPRTERAHNYDAVAELVAERIEKSHARISAKRLLPIARAAGYEGSERNFRRLVAESKALWRSNNHSGRRHRDCSCSARCWRSPAGGLSASPPTSALPRRWR
jgi:hypothetical protein